MGLLGLVLFLALAYGLSSDRSAIRLSTVLWGLGLQLTLAILVLRTPFGKVFHVIGEAVNRMMLLAETGSQFVFGDLGSSEGPMGIVLAFQILPLIVFVSSLFAVLYYLGIMQQIVRGIAIVMQRVMGASGAESLNMAANIFMGQSEAPLTIRPYLEKLTRSELMTVMTGGMATISGSVARGLRTHRRRAGRAYADGRDHDGAGGDPDGKDARAGDGNARDIRNGAA